MKFSKFKQNKLWRDKAVELMEQTGSKIHWSKLSDDEFLDQLKIKFMEEAHEVYQAKTKEALLEELSDILEVIASFCEVHKFTMHDIIYARYY
jgi:predicted house-cleaning noncanonical NTP pyrophosphatase (MazG superfamily)